MKKLGMLGILHAVSNLCMLAMYYIRNALTVCGCVNYNMYHDTVFPQIVTFGLLYFQTDQNHRLLYFQCLLSWFRLK